MPGKYADTYELSAGMHDDTNAVIQFGTFRTDPQYNNGNTLLLVLSLTDETGEPFDHMLSIGGDWMTADGGETVQHPSGPNKKFNRGSNYGKWLAACADIPSLWDLITDRGPSNDSRIWEHVKVHLKTVQETYTIQGEEKTRVALLPDAFLGVDGGAQTVVVPQQLNNHPSATIDLTPQQRIAAAKAAAAAPQPSPNGLSPDQASALNELAKSSTDHQDFLIKALDLDWVLIDEELTAQLADPSGFYAQARS